MRARLNLHLAEAEMPVNLGNNPLANRASSYWANAVWVKSMWDDTSMTGDSNVANGASYKLLGEYLSTSVLFA